MLGKRFKKLAVLVAAVAAFTVGGLAGPAQASAVHPAAGNGSVTKVEAGSIPQTQNEVSNVLAQNGVAQAWPAINNSLTPQLQKAVAVGGGQAAASADYLTIEIDVECEISYPPLEIACTITITVSS